MSAVKKEKSQLAGLGVMKFVSCARCAVLHYSKWPMRLVNLWAFSVRLNAIKPNHRLPLCRIFLKYSAFILAGFFNPIFPVVEEEQQYIVRSKNRRRLSYSELSDTNYLGLARSPVIDQSQWRASTWYFAL